MSAPTTGGTADLVERYIVLTKETMPTLAQTSHGHWPVCNDHCFQRIVLDAICGGVWYDHLPRPAYKHLTHDQAAKAVELCDSIISGDADLVTLNQQSLAWRGKTGVIKKSVRTPKL
jgi:hypothetical protein